MDNLDKLRGHMQSLRSDPDSDCDDMADSDVLLWAVTEIERLRGMLEAHGINHDNEYIAKSGLRVDATRLGTEPDFQRPHLGGQLGKGQRRGVVTIHITIKVTVANGGPIRFPRLMRCVAHSSSHADQALVKLCHTHHIKCGLV